MKGIPPCRKGVKKTFGSLHGRLRQENYGQDPILAAHGPIMIMDAALLALGRPISAPAMAPDAGLDVVCQRGILWQIIEDNRVTVVQRYVHGAVSKIASE